MSPIRLCFLALSHSLPFFCAGKKKTATGQIQSIQKRVEAIYARVVPCLELTPTLNNQILSFDTDLESHWKEILLVTGQYRHLPPHNGSYYAGTIAAKHICPENALIKLFGIGNAYLRSRG